LTDSGGFQIFSLERLNRVSDEAVVFRSHVDGQVLKLSPERVVEIQEMLGSDVAMVLDHVVALPCEGAEVNQACRRTILWAERSRKAARRADQALFAIVQGGLDPQMRLWCAERLVEMDFPGYAVGGLSVGESPQEMRAMLDVTCPALPADRPRYLMGVGRPRDILEGIRRGIDLFDCVMPTRNGRNALAFTHAGPLRLRNQIHRRDPRPLEPDCPCVACRHSRGYLHHLFKAGEMLGPILLSVHNLTYYQRLMDGARRSIAAGQFMDFYSQTREGWAGSTCLGKTADEA
jgi:queuine tRNA-ribosyltransferase